MNTLIKRCKNTFLAYGLTFFVERGRGKEWEGWFRGEDHTTYLNDSKRELIKEMVDCAKSRFVFLDVGAGI